MDTRTGELIDMKSYDQMSEEEKKHYRVIEATKSQAAQGKVDKYDPCPCGSGKKFKWCCWTGYSK